MTQPIRPIVTAICELSKAPEEYTFREAIEWWKSVARNDDIGVPNELEKKKMDKTFVTILEGIGKREGIIPGYMGWFLSEIAQAELKLAQTAESEAEAALEYGKAK